ncbi:ABC transporter permease [Gramella sp. BOM4]|nr:ABC transporter permease [Christiangramia bathymodioli]
MFRNYIKIAFRNIRKNKLYSFINIGGLSLGLTACILIMFYVSHEHSFDKFHEDSDDIYMLRAKALFGGDTIFVQNFSAATGQMVQENSAFVDDNIRIFQEYKPLIIKRTGLEPKSFSEEGFFYTDPNYFNFFSFSLLKGNPETALKEPFSLLISEEMANKYFGDENPIGEILQVEKDSIYNYTVKGVIAETPSNSSIQHKFVASVSSLQKTKGNDGLFNSPIVRGGAFKTYFKINDATQIGKIAETTNRLSKEGNSESKDLFFLYPFTETHLKFSRNAGIGYLDVFPLIAGLILLLALINYMSLTTARASSRSKEIGIRKVNGASRKEIAFQFYIESTLFISLSFLLAGILSFLLKDFFFNLLDINIDTAFFLNQNFILTLALIFMVSILIAGMYPSMVMASFNPIENFKKKTRNDLGGGLVRKVCTTLQFIIAVILIIGGITIREQMSHLQNIDTGLNRSDILMISLEKSMGNNIPAFRKEVEKLPAVKGTSISGYPLYGGYDMFYASSENGEPMALPFISIDKNFFDVLELKWKLPPEDPFLPEQPKKLVINETAIEKFKLKNDPRGQNIEMAGAQFEVVGVVNDFHYSSLDSPINSLAMMVSKSNSSINKFNSGSLYVKYQKTSSLPALIKSIESSYVKFDAEKEFSYQFMDDAFNEMFKSEQRLAHIFNIFVVLTIIIAGLGLLGLATFSAQKRIKEIGIRKTLGASVFQITSSLSLDFLKIVLFAIIIAIPIAWLLARNWLENFVYRIDLNIWIFLMASFSTMFIAVLTVSFQAFRAATSNPVKSLRTE